MTREDLLARLRAGEDTLTELKTAGHESDVKRGIVAFANSATPERAGVLFLGARKDGSAIGVENATSLGEKVATWASECYPPIRFECVVLPVDGRDILTVVIPASAERPHFAAQAYVREGPKTVKAPPSVYENLIASRNTAAGAILLHKGETITVVREQRLTGRGNQHERILRLGPEEWRIEDCSAHSVELYNLGSQSTASFSLERVVITADPNHHRPLMLFIRAV